MKKLTIIMAAVALLLPLIGFCQTQNETVYDSSWIINKNGIFFQANLKVFADGQETTELKPYGDTITTAQKFRDNIAGVAGTFASDAQIVSNYRNQITELIRFGRTLPGIIGRNPLDTILKSQANVFDNTGWRLSTGGSQIGIRFRQTANGTFQWRADSTTNWRSAAFLGAVIRLNGLNGYTTDFFKDQKGRWHTINKQYTIKQPGDIAARTTTDDLPEEPAAPTSEPKPEFLPNGTVRVGEVVHKYNRNKKRWEIAK